MTSLRPSTASDFPGQIQRALHLCAMVQVAIAYPLYDLLSRYPEFFVARQSQPVDITLLVLALTVGLPAILFGLQALASLLDQRLGRAAQLLLIAALSLLLGLSLAHHKFEGPAQLLLGAAFGLLLTIAYARTRVGKLFLTFLAPAIIAVPAVFLLNPGIASLLQPADTGPRTADPAGTATTPIVFIVFDELPTFALLDASGRIDGNRFPNLQELVSTSYWFPNATTVATSTVLAIPPIVTGQYPTAFVMPHQGEYPDNLFTWLGRDYDLNVEEAVSALCPRSLCESTRLPSLQHRVNRLLLDGSAIYLNIVAAELLSGKLPVITQSWEDFWDSARPGGQLYEHRLQQLTEFAERIQVTAKPGLEFIHINFPHIPYEYLPSGKRYAEGWLMPGLDFATDVWTGTPAQTAAAFERFQLQLGALDRWLGTLLDRLKSLDLYDRSVIVLTADHGVSFTAGASRRDAPPLDNLERNILPVPLIIKAPNQSQGVVSRHNAETVDIMPTLAELLDRPLTWPVDGASLLGEPKPARKRAVHSYKALALFETDAGRIEKLVLESAREASSWNSGGAASQYFTDGQQALIGATISDLLIRENAQARARVRDQSYFSSVDLQSRFLPAHASGVIESPAQSPTTLAIALNDVIVALTRSYAEDSAWKFSAMLPESGFRNGANSLRVFAVAPGDDGQPMLTHIGPDPARQDDEWQLDGNVLVHNGARLPIDSEGIQGRVDYLSHGEESVEVFGWVIDAAQKRVVEEVLAFDGERLVYRGQTTMLREETHAFDVILKVGFHAVIPLDRMAGKTGADLRVFAVTLDGRARELLRDRQPQ